jgi:hypothetical protein
VNGDVDKYLRGSWLDQEEKSVTSNDIPLRRRKLETQVGLRFEANREISEVLKKNLNEKKKNISAHGSMCIAISGGLFTCPENFWGLGSAGVKSNVVLELRLWVFFDAKFILQNEKKI